MFVYLIQAHTKWGYKKGYDVHHIDGNKLNDGLSNLVYLTRSEHVKAHMNDLLSADTRKKLSEAHSKLWQDSTYRDKMIEKMRECHADVSSETKLKISIAIKGKTKGMTWWNNGVISTRAKDCPEGFVKGRPKGQLNAKQKGMVWWNNGIINKKAKECPEGFVKGKLRKNA